MNVGDQICDKRIGSQKTSFTITLSGSEISTYSYRSHPQDSTLQFVCHLIKIRNKLKISIKNHSNIPIIKNHLHLNLKPNPFFNGPSLVIKYSLYKQNIYTTQTHSSPINSLLIPSGAGPNLLPRNSVNVRNR